VFRSCPSPQQSRFPEAILEVGNSTTDRHRNQDDSKPEWGIRQRQNRPNPENAIALCPSLYALISCSLDAFLYMRLVRRRHPDRVSPVELTPMIDVIFLLIIFFMTTAQFAQLTRAELDLPQEHGEQDPAADESGLVINITSDGQIIVNDRSITLTELDAHVSRYLSEVRTANRRDIKLTLRVDRQADSTNLNRVIRLLQDRGVPAARLATEIPR
jgi:biopolymer transport protein ExbD